MRSAGAPENPSSTGNDSDHPTRPMLLGTSKPPNLFGVWGKPPKNTPTPKVSANLWRMWQMWRIDNLLLEIPLSLRSRCNWVLRVQRVRGNLFGHWRCGMDAPGDAYHPLSRSAPNRMRGRRRQAGCVLSWAFIARRQGASILGRRTSSRKDQSLAQQACTARVVRKCGVKVRASGCIHPVLPASASLRRRVFVKVRGFSHTLGRRFPKPKVRGDSRKASEDRGRGPMLWRRTTSVVSGERLSRSHRRPMDGK